MYSKESAPNPELPVPRLEIRWEEHRDLESYYDLRATYSLVYGSRMQVCFVPLGVTRTTGSLASCIEDNGAKIRTPIASGCEILQDMSQLALPGFVIAGKKVFPVKVV